MLIPSRTVTCTQCTHREERLHADTVASYTVRTCMSVHMHTHEQRRQLMSHSTAFLA